MDQLIRCPHCGSEDLLMLAWVNNSGELVELFVDEHNPYYIGDSEEIENAKCLDCGESFII